MLTDSFNVSKGLDNPKPSESLSPSRFLLAFCNEATVEWILGTQCFTDKTGRRTQQDSDDRLAAMNLFLWRKVRSALGCWVLAAITWHASALGQTASAPQIAAAADLQYVLPILVSAFERKTGSEIQVSFGSSGNLARQIVAGAAFELFLSADALNVQQLVAAGRAASEGRHYATGRLVLFLPTGSPLRADSDLADFVASLSDGRLKRLAMANPAHAPYGRAAQEVLTNRGVWALAQERLVLGDNVAQAAQFAVSGAAQAGLLPLSLAMAPALRDRGAFVTLPAHWHAPIRQTLLVIKGASPSARAFADYLVSDDARRVFSANGFAVPSKSGQPGSD